MQAYITKSWHIGLVNKETLTYIGLGINESDR